MLGAASFKTTSITGQTIDNITSVSYDPSFWFPLPFCPSSLISISLLYERRKRQQVLEILKHSNG